MELSTLFLVFGIVVVLLLLARVWIFVLKVLIILLLLAIIVVLITGIDPAALFAWAADILVVSL